MEFLFFEPLLPQAKSIAVPVQNLNLIPGAVDEYIQSLFQYEMSLKAERISNEK